MSEPFTFPPSAFSFSSSTTSSSSSSPTRVPGNKCSSCSVRPRCRRFTRGSGGRCASEPHTNNIPNTVSSTATPNSISTTPFHSFSFPPFSSTPFTPASEPPKTSSVPVPDETKQEDMKGETNSTIRNCGSTSELVSDTPLPLTVISRILMGIPHNPHFLPLRSYSELAREKLIIAWDWSFEEIVDQIHALRVEGFWVRAGKLWKTLEELESLGYNVILLRKRMVELTDVMVELKSSKSIIRGLKSKAECHRMEKSRLEWEISRFQAKAEREQACVEEAMDQVAKMKEDLPNFDGVFANLAMKPL